VVAVAARVLVGELVAELAPRLASLGFKKRAGEVFTCVLADDVLGWVGLNRGHSAGAVEINPVMGVRHQVVEQRVAEALGEKFHQYIPPTVSSPLGYLMGGRYKAWFVAAVDDAQSVAAEIAGVVEQVGLPFMRSNMGLNRLVESIQGGLTASREQGATRLPVALSAAGECAGARQVIETELDRLAGRDDPAANRFRQFAQGFRPLGPAD